MRIDEASSDPLYQQVKDVLRGEITSGRFKPGGSIPHERALAESLKVSRKTTRRAIVELTREGLLRRVRGRGTYVRESMNSRTLRKDCVLIASVYSPFAFPFYGKIVEGIYQAAAQSNALTAFEIITQPYDAFLAKVKRYETLSGILAIGVDDHALLPQLNRLDVPVVLVDGDQPAEKTPFDIVTHDPEPGMIAAVKYLQDLGHRQIAFLGSEPSAGSNRKRINGYKRAMSGRGEPQPDLILNTGYSAEAAYATTIRLLNNPKVPTAIVCTSDEHAIGAIEAVKDFGWRVPEDMSIVGVGDIGLFTWPKLSTVRVPKEQIGKMAMQVLEMRKTHPTSALQRLNLPVEFAPLGTCGVPREIPSRMNGKSLRKSAN
jgi:DNA-binding LacI/PurR family transcriptional regulator